MVLLGSGVKSGFSVNWQRFCSHTDAEPLERNAIYLKFLTRPRPPHPPHPSSPLPVPRLEGSSAGEAAEPLRHSDDKLTFS